MRITHRFHQGKGSIFAESRQVRTDLGRGLFANARNWRVKGSGSHIQARTEVEARSIGVELGGEEFLED